MLNPIWRPAFTALLLAALAEVAGPAALARGQEIATFDLRAPNLTVAFSPDGKSLAYEDPDRQLIRVIDLDTKKERAYEGHERQVQHVAFSPDGKLLAGADQGGVLNLFDVQTGKVRHSITGVLACLRPLGFAPKGDLLAAIHADGAVGVYETRTFKQLAKLKGGGALPSGVALSPDGQSLAVGLGGANARGAGGGVVEVYSVAEKKLRWRQQDFPKGYCSVAFSPDGKLVAAAGERGRLTLRDAATGERQAAFDQSDQLRGRTGPPLFLPGKVRPAFYDDTMSFVFFWEAGNDREARLFQTGHVGGIRAVALSPDGRTLATAGEDRRIKLWDLSKVKKLVRLSDLF